MIAVALIPARLAATRFPGKLLALLRGTPVICRTYQAAVRTGLFSQVIVVSDSDEIIDHITAIGGTAIKSEGTYESGTDRIAAVAAGVEADVFVNIQGDEPFVQAAPLAMLLQLFTGAGGQDTQVASLAQRLTDPGFIKDPNYVKVALDMQGNALFFSRSVLPYPRDSTVAATYYEHIGVYAFTRQALQNFTSWQPTPLELAEKIECLRFLEHGMRIRMAVTSYMGVEIDTPADLLLAEQLMLKMGWE